MSVELDKFGIAKLFPDKLGGITLTQDDPRVWINKYSKHGYKSIKNKKIWRKTFGFKSKEKYGPDLESTIYIYFTNLNPEYGSHPKIGKCSSGSGLSIKLRGGTHSSSSKKSAKCYIGHYEYEGGKCNNFQKEYPHPKYLKETVTEKQTLPNWVGRIMGFKFITINSIENDSVHCYSYFDDESLIWSDFKGFTPSNKWKLRYHVIDKGQFGKGKLKAPFLDCNGKYTEFRMDNVPKDTLAFGASLREISSTLI